MNKKPDQTKAFEHTTEAEEEQMFAQAAALIARGIWLAEEANKMRAKRGSLKVACIVNRPRITGLDLEIPKIQVIFAERTA